MECIFGFDLENNLLDKAGWGNFGVRYFKYGKNVLVEVGDGFMREMHISAKYWNRILKMIKQKELDEKDIEAIVRGLMGHFIPEKYEENFLSAVKNGVIKEVGSVPNK